MYLGVPACSWVCTCDVVKSKVSLRELEYDQLLTKWSQSWCLFSTRTPLTKNCTIIISAQHLLTSALCPCFWVDFWTTSKKVASLSLIPNVAEELQLYKQNCILAAHLDAGADLCAHQQLTASKCSVLQHCNAHLSQTTLLTSEFKYSIFKAALCNF